MADTFLERALIWEKAKSGLEAAIAAERLARDALIEIDFADRQAGTNTKALPDGRVVKCVADTDYKAEADAARTCIGKLEALGEQGRLIAGRLFKWRPEVAVGELKKLDAKMRRIADKAIVTRPTRPSIRIETPKGG